jgi:predicted transcriptional regulator
MSYNASSYKERDPIINPGDHGRAEVANGQRFKTWVRFHSEADLVWVETIDGRMVGLTPWQAKVYDLGKTYMDRGTVTFRALAAELGCAPSTVSRALVKLMSWGLLGYVTGRGRYAGSVIFRMAKGDGLDRFRDAAKAKVKAWSQAAQRRLSRLEINVAPYFLERGGGSEVDTLYYYLTSIYKSATLTAPWTAQDVEGIV